MSKVRFEETELNIIAIFEESTRQDTIDYIKEALEFIDEKDEELHGYMKGAIEKLEQLSDDGFNDFDFSRYLFEEDEDES